MTDNAMTQCPTEERKQGREAYTNFLSEPGWCNTLLSLGLCLNLRSITLITVIKYLPCSFTYTDWFQLNFEYSFRKASTPPVSKDLNPGLVITTSATS